MTAALDNRAARSRMRTAMFHAWLPGEPVPQARPRVTRGGHVFYPAKSAAYRKRIATLLQYARRGQTPISGPVKLTLYYYRARPKSNKSPQPIVKPDLDNLAKQTIDALVDAGVIYDDGQVCALMAVKAWATKTAGVDVAVEAHP